MDLDISITLSPSEESHELNVLLRWNLVDFYQTYLLPVINLTALLSLQAWIFLYWPVLGNGYMENTFYKPEEEYEGEQILSVDGGRFYHCTLWTSEETLLSCMYEALVIELYFYGVMTQGFFWLFLGCILVTTPFWSGPLF